MYLCLKVVLC